MLIEVGGTVLNEDEYDYLVEDIMTDYDFGFPYEILNERKTHLRAEEIRDLAAQLNNTFSWCNTREGIVFWFKVYDGLMRIAEKGR